MKAAITIGGEFAYFTPGEAFAGPDGLRIDPISAGRIFLGGSL
jgi:hypothetical protein